MGVVIMIEGGKVVKFKFGKVLKDVLNQLVLVFVSDNVGVGQFGLCWQYEWVFSLVGRVVFL